MASKFGKYEILETLGEGGMGTVYKARQGGSRQVLALKVLHSDTLASATGRQRFVREGRIMARLRHPNIVPIYEMGEVGGVPCIGMEYVQGRTLAALLKEGVPDERQAATWLLKVASAVGHAHANGIIHRDLKPGNVIIDGHGEPMVTDFGLAKDIKAGPALTTTDELLGTPSYMSPEQVKGEDLDARSDIFALGAILYSLLTGRAPFTGSVANVIFKITQRDPERPSQINLSVSRQLESICLKALRKRPADRYQLAGDMAADLSAFLTGGHVGVRRESIVRRALRRVRQGTHLPRVVLSGIAGVMLAGAVVLLLGRLLTTNGCSGSSPRRDRVLAEIDGMISAGQHPQALERCWSEITSTWDPRLAEELSGRIRTIEAMFQPGKTVADGDRLLASGRLEAARAAYRAAGADEVRMDLVGRLAALRDDAQASLLSGPAGPVRKDERAGREGWVARDLPVRWGEPPWNNWPQREAQACLKSSAAWRSSANSARGAWGRFSRPGSRGSTAPLR